MWERELFGFDIFYLFYHFIFYSFIGWIYESCLVSFQQKKWVNRGFFNGPLIPIYGAGATVVTVSLYQIHNDYVAVFFAGMLLATVLEFVTSFIMEKLFHAKWWDYSEWKFNIQGRVCLYVSLFWGLLSVSMFGLFKPGMDRLIFSIPRREGEIAGYIIMAAFTADFFITVISTMQFDKKLADLQKIRSEFIEYIASTRLYGKAEDLRERFMNSMYQEWGDKLRVFLENSQTEHEYKKKLEEKMDNYQGKLTKANPIHKRLLNAFPNLKPVGRENVLKDWKEKLAGGKKKRNRRKR